MYPCLVEVLVLRHLQRPRLLQQQPQRLRSRTWAAVIQRQDNVGMLLKINFNVICHVNLYTYQKHSAFNGILKVIGTKIIFAKLMVQYYYVTRYFRLEICECGVAFMLCMFEYIFKNII